ncbi:unnamed protein product [Prorocentrum cordatum]|uniref:Hexosyltransferase n=1 Tax=Prorocentrum cordatum TaxID=2364126 RepID=A0ABN9PQL5_9DINO|nr:unnamed protein product [Polarella glacialis]
MWSALLQRAPARKTVYLCGAAVISMLAMALHTFRFVASQDLGRTPRPEKAAPVSLTHGATPPASLPSGLAASELPPASRWSGRSRSAVAVFVQMANHSHWSHLRECVANVLDGARPISQRGAQLTRNVDVYIGLLAGNSSIEEDAHLLVRRRNVGGEYQARLVINSTLVNKAADVGLFLQQIQQVRDPSQYEILLKVHSKGRHEWRCQMLTSLCGSTEQVKQVFDRFDHQRELGLMGPWSLTWGYDDMANLTKVEQSYDHLSCYAFLNVSRDGKPGPLAHMRDVWDFMFDHGAALPPRDKWLVAAGSAYWARSAPLLQNPRLDRAVSRWLPLWEPGYNSSCRARACRDAFGLERVLPTIMISNTGCLPRRPRTGTCRTSRTITVVDAWTACRHVHTHYLEKVKRHGMREEKHGTRRRRDDDDRRPGRGGGLLPR